MPRTPKSLDDMVHGNRDPASPSGPGSAAGAIDEHRKLQGLASGALGEVAREALAEDRKLRKLASGGLDDGALGIVGRAVEEQRKLQKLISGAVGHDALGIVGRAVEEQRKLQTLIAGGFVGGAVQRAIEEQRKFERLINGGSSVDGRYRSPAREQLDSLAFRGDASAVTAAGTATGPARAHSGAADPATIESAADIGRRVRAARRAMGMTQQRFADLAGVGRRFVVELEKGKPTLEIGRVLTVCRAAGIKLTFAP